MIEKIEKKSSFYLENENNDEHLIKTLNNVNNLLTIENSELIKKIKLLEEKINKFQQNEQFKINLESSKKLYFSISIIFGIISLYFFIKYKKLQKRNNLHLIIIEAQFNDYRKLRERFDNKNIKFLKQPNSNINSCFNDLEESKNLKEIIEKFQLNLLKQAEN